MWRQGLLFWLWTNAGAALTDYFAISEDMNTAWRDALNARYSTANEDLAPLLERYRQERTDEDWTRIYESLIKKARGLEAPGA